MKLRRAGLSSLFLAVIFLSACKPPHPPPVPGPIQPPSTPGTIAPR